MTILSASFSQALLQVVQQDRPQISAVEIGPWFSEAQILNARRLLPKQIAIHFHASNLLTSKLWLSGAISSLQTYHDLTQSPWATPHIDLLLPGYLRLFRRFRLALPIPGTGFMVRRFIQRVQRLQQALDVPVVLENMPMLPGAPFNFQADPQIINHILQQTGCNMLLDTGHARIAASIGGVDIYEYLGQLPLEKVVHIHVSGPREKDGFLFDAHEPLAEEDYQILHWLLGRTQPKVITLEYFREADPLREQLDRLAGML